MGDSMAHTTTQHGAKPVEIYKDIEAIYAKKGGNSLWPKKPFKHKFEKGSSVLGIAKDGKVPLRQGDLVIRSRQGKHLWRFFDYKKHKKEDEMKEPFLVNPPKHARKHGRSRGSEKTYHRKRKSNPIGETLITVGGNPMQYFHRKNPVSVQAGLKTVMDVKHWGPLAVTGGLSAAAAGILPGMIAQYTGTNPWVQIGVRLAIAFGGGMAVGQYVSKEHGSVWAVVGTSLVAYDLLKQYLFPTLGLSGFAYDGYEQQGDSQVNAFPQAQGMSAYPDQGGIQAFPLGDVGSYPFDGQYGSYATMT